MISPRSVPVPTTTPPGTDAAALRRWRHRLAERVEVVRDLPWRDSRDPWAVLVSEVMLQQTQVSRVIPSWESFLDVMPTPQACAGAGQAEVVRRWEGLGYHRRAVALHRSAVEIVDRHHGVLPRDLDALLALSGVGPYTARAVLAFAFEEDVAVVDTNVARVLSRAVAGASLTASRAQALADALIPKGDAWRHNQAMLDLGALHCRARPLCDACPLRRSCVWNRAGRPAPDPALGSAGTSKPQSRFEGSDRQLRGRLLDSARKGQHRSLWSSDLEERFGADRVAHALRALESEGLVIYREGVLGLA